jgi:hypothetical protein
MLLQLVPTNLSRVVIVKFAASLLSDLRQTCLQQTIFVLSQQVSHSIISICNIIKMQNSISRCFIFKNSSDFQFTDVCYRYISLIWLDKGVCVTSSFLDLCNWTKYYKHTNHVIMFSCFWILIWKKFQQLPQTKSNKFTRKRRKFKAVLIFEETVAMRIQDLELKKWKKHKQPSVQRSSSLIWIWTRDEPIRKIADYWGRLFISRLL